MDSAFFVVLHTNTNSFTKNKNKKIMSNLKETNRFVVGAILVSCVFISIMSVEARKKLGFPGLGFGESRANPYPPPPVTPTPVCDPKFPETCPPKQPVNPYRRGCQVITRCRRSTGRY